MNICATIDSNQDSHKLKSETYHLCNNTRTNYIFLIKITNLYLIINNNIKKYMMFNYIKLQILEDLAALNCKLSTITKHSLQVALLDQNFKYSFLKPWL